MMDMFLTEEHKIFRDQIRRFCEVEIAPLVEEAEEKEEFPKHLFPEMGKLGYLAIRYPEKYGSADVDKLTDVLLREEMSRVCQGIASSWSTHSHLATFPICHKQEVLLRHKSKVSGIRGILFWPALKLL